jgi:hypothetical protein
MRRYGRVAALLIALVSLFAAGCGGGDDDKALSKAEYLKQGNAICKKGNDAIDAAGQALGESPTKAQITAFATDTLIPSVSTQIKDLRALDPPEEDADTLTALYDDAEAALEKIKANPETVASENDPFADVNKRATAYGLTECGDSD